MILLSPEDGLAELPQPGDPVVVEIELPANHAFGRKCMQCQTTVVRTSAAETGAQRMALRINKMRFESCVSGTSGGKERKMEAEIRQLLM